MSEKLADGREHLTEDGQFKSDKYEWSPAGFLPLKFTDPLARDLIAQYAVRRQEIDSEFALDVLEALGRSKAK